MGYQIAINVQNLLVYYLPHNCNIPKFGKLYSLENRPSIAIKFLKLLE